jgi:hypothetical protein
MSITKSAGNSQENSWIKQGEAALRTKQKQGATKKEAVYRNKKGQPG